MTNHPNRSRRALPVLDDDSFEAMVLGFARTETGARRIAMRWAALRGEEGIIEVQPVGAVRVTHDPDINTRQQADRANAAGRGWIVVIQ